MSVVGIFGEELDLPRDADGRIVGFGVGKEAAMRDWAARKEERYYEALFKRLAARNAARRSRSRDPERAREQVRAWRSRNYERNRELDRARKQRISEKRRHMACVCEVCSTRFTPARNVSGHKYCSEVCRQRACGRRRTAEGRRRKGLRCTTTRSDVLRALRRGAWRTAREIHAALPPRDPSPSFGSVATLLTELVAGGVVRHCGAKKHRRYALAEERRSCPERKAVT